MKNVICLKNKTKQKTKANGSQRFTPSTDFILGEVNVENKFRVRPLFIQIMMAVSRPITVIHLCNCIWVCLFVRIRHGEARWMLGEMKGVQTSTPIQTRFQVIFVTGIKVRFLCRRVQVFFVNGSL